MNAVQEENLIKRFKEMYSGFPAGNLRRGNPPLPDYLVETDEGLIGIELTEIFHTGDGKQRSSFKNTLTEKVIETLADQMPFKFSLDIFPDTKVRTSKHEVASVARDVANHCLREFYRLADHETGEIEHIELDLQNPEYAMVKNKILRNGYRNLPPGISRIRMTRHDILKQSYNASSEAGMVPRLTLADVAVPLHKKEQRIEAYGPLKEQWLIVQEGNYFSSYFDEIDFTLPIASFFDHVFLFRLMHNEIIALK